VAQIDRGFGSPTTIPQQGTHPQDRGFGSPTSWTPSTAYGLGDAGFGSPYSPIVLLFPPLGPFPLLPPLDPIDPPPPPALFGDEGGYVYGLQGSWPIPGPYTVRFLDGLGAPHPAVGGAYSAIAGERDRCATNPFGDLLVFTIPPLNPGLYDIKITWQPGGELVFEDAIRIIRRNRDAETYRLRRGYQELFEVGPGLLEGEPELGDVGEEFPKQQHRAVRTHVYGKAMQALAGAPVTRVRQTYTHPSASLAVESTLAFPERGRVWCLGQLFRYSAKSDDELLGFEILPNQEFPWSFDSLHQKAVVTFDASSYFPT
jgi:hypothetical protein